MYNESMKEPICIRYFSTFNKADSACKLLISEGYEAEVVEDKFNNNPLPHFKVPARFRLLIEKDKLEEISNLLLSKLPKKINN